MADEDKAPRVLGRDHLLQTPVDINRAADFSVGTLNSGAQASGQGLVIFQVSSPVRVRILNLEMFNAEPGWIEVEFRDGISTGGRVLGPYSLLPRSRTPIPYEELVGRYFTSAIYGIVLSGYTAQPLSNGVLVKLSRWNDPTDLRE